MKRVLTSCLVVLICLTAFLSGYGKGCYSYATNQDGTLTNDELDVAVSSWLQSHGGNLFSPQNYRIRKTYEAGLIHNFIYSDGGGYDVVRQHINGGAGGNNELKFDFDGFIIHKLNTWLNRKLQSGEFGEGAELNENGMFNDDINNELYSGQYFVDADGIGCLVYEANTYSTLNQQFTALGTPYKYTTNQIITNVGTSNATFTFNLYQNLTKTYTLYYYSKNYNSSGLYDYTSVKITDSNQGIGYGNVFYKVNTGTYQNNSFELECCKNSQYCIVNFSGVYYLCYLAQNIDNNLPADSYNWRWYCKQKQQLNGSDADTTDANIFFYTNNNLNITDYPDIDVEGKLYITPKVKINGEYKPYIINEGDTINSVINQYYIDSNTPDNTISYPSNDANDNGGGNDNPSGGNDNPSGGTPPDWSNNFPHLSPDGEGGFNFNFTLPDLNIDWNISGLKDKFPFSIPFDLIHFVEVLNAEPETPEFDWTIDLKIYQWHIDADLHQFDNLAGIVRNIEFIGFCITLVMITRRMIKG